eukprot:7119840-Pyramimonas_sp.AAC.1
MSTASRSRCKERSWFFTRIFAPLFVVSTVGVRLARSVKPTSFATLTGITMPGIAAPNSHLDTAEGGPSIRRSRSMVKGRRTSRSATSHWGLAPRA